MRSSRASAPAAPSWASGRFLRSPQPRASSIHPLEPAESPTLSTGHKVGQHRIQGISDEFIPAIVKLDELDAVIAVNDGDAILMAQQLAQHGLAVGISSGANLLGALKMQDELGPDCRRGHGLLRQQQEIPEHGLAAAEPVRDGYLSPDVEVTGFHAMMRVCTFCA